MTYTGKMLKNTTLLGCSQVFCFGASFARNIILARLMTKADFGMASIFAMVVTLLEFAGRMAIGQQIVQSKDGDTPAFQAASQLFQFLLGLLSAILILCLSQPFASLFNVPSAAWAFACLAVLPLAKGLEHLDVARKTRNLDYRAAILSDVTPQLLITFLAWPLAAWLRDFRALLVLLLSKAILTLALTHLLAERKYQWKYDLNVFKSMYTFGWPLLLNGFLMFAILQGDQFIVGACYSLADVASYFVAATITLVPGFMIVQVISAMMLPLLSRVQDEQQEFARTYNRCLESLAFAITLVTMVLITFGGLFIRLIYGNKYLGLEAIVAWLALANCFRVIRAAPTLAAMAKGDTKNNLVQNLFRFFGVVLALFAAGSGCGLAVISASGFVGEILAFLVSMRRLSQRQHISLTTSLRPVAIGGLFLGFACFLASTLAGHLSWLVVSTIVLCAVATIVMYNQYHALRPELQRFLGLALGPRGLRRLVGAGI